MPIAVPPKSLYSCKELMDGYNADRIGSILETFTFLQYLEFEPYKKDGLPPGEGLGSIAAHDAAISRLLLDFLYQGPDAPRKVVGIMGGHSQPRSSLPYQNMATLARFLARNDYLIVTGGGPGMMEAAHLGAYFRNVDDTVWRGVMASLKELEPGSSRDVIPDAKTVVDDNGIRRTQYDQVGLHAWYKFASDLLQESQQPGKSLAISTWEYGNEPVMPFATAYACYFQNSIRESQLVRQARAGIIYGRGGGGTLREIWQDVEENFYVGERELLTPMIFYDHEGIWGDIGSNGTRPLDVFGTILRVLNYAHRRHSFSWEDKVVATVDSQKILGLLDQHVGPAHSNLMTLVAQMRVIQ